MTAKKNCTCDPHHTLSDDGDVMNVAVCGGVTRRAERGYHVQSHLPRWASVQPTGESRHRDGCVRARRARWRRRGLVVHAVLNRPVAPRQLRASTLPQLAGSRPLTLNTGAVGEVNEFDQRGGGVRTRCARANGGRLGANAQDPRLPNRSMSRPCPPSGAAPYGAHPFPAAVVNSSIPAKKKPAAAEAEAGQSKGGTEPNISLPRARECDRAHMTPAISAQAQSRPPRLMPQAALCLGVAFRIPRRVETVALCRWVPPIRPAGGLFFAHRLWPLAVGSGYWGSSAAVAPGPQGMSYAQQLPPRANKREIRNDPRMSGELGLALALLSHPGHGGFSRVLQDRPSHQA
jgi:hypothetical protein